VQFRVPRRGARAVRVASPFSLEACEDRAVDLGALKLRLALKVGRRRWRGRGGWCTRDGYACPEGGVQPGNSAEHPRFQKFPYKEVKSSQKWEKIMRSMRLKLMLM